MSVDRLGCCEVYHSEAANLVESRPFVTFVLMRLPAWLGRLDRIESSSGSEAIGVIQFPSIHIPFTIVGSLVEHDILRGWSTFRRHCTGVNILARWISDESR